ncbi:MAG: ATP-binding cassette domain-containing protein [Deltaproteobacteria bacterium]|nr:ATP-binding cassette domain-containing protein [Deltaproteobacteria bacterium]MBW2123769.1 ATP-binding cassette domain-containing protein [Deltaproteobacteria bacterium]
MTEATVSENVVVVEGLKKYYRLRTGFVDKMFMKEQKYVKAVDDVSLEIGERKTFGLVGESGCGKSTLGRCILRLEPITDGTITVFGQDIGGLDENGLRHFRKRAQMIFQNPYSTLPPHKTIGRMLKEVVDYHRVVDGKEAGQYCLSILEQVGLDGKFFNSRPKTLSGGQRQRAAIARALATEPRFIILDEPVTALDISIQAQILNLLMRLQEEKGLTYLFIAHDLSVIRHVSDVIGVMYLGKMVEFLPADELGSNSAHPYTRSLMSSSPMLSELFEGEKIRLTGELPSAIDPPQGCRFHTRCPYCFDRCKKEEPRLKSVGESHLVSCFLCDR